MWSTGQAAFLALIVVAMASLPLALLWVVIYLHLADRKTALRLRNPAAEVVDMSKALAQRSASQRHAA